MLNLSSRSVKHLGDNTAPLPDIHKAKHLTALLSQEHDLFNVASKPSGSPDPLGVMRDRLLAGTRNASLSSTKMNRA